MPEEIAKIKYLRFEKEFAANTTVKLARLPDTGFSRFEIELSDDSNKRYYVILEFYDATPIYVNSSRVDKDSFETNKFNMWIENENGGKILYFSVALLKITAFGVGYGNSDTTIFIEQTASPADNPAEIFFGEILFDSMYKPIKFVNDMAVSTLNVGDISTQSAQKLKVSILNVDRNIHTGDSIKAKTMTASTVNADNLNITTKLAIGPWAFTTSSNNDVTISRNA